jgi:GAF domain-containing protein
VVAQRQKEDGLQGELLQARKDVRKLAMQLRASSHRVRKLELKNSRLKGTVRMQSRSSDLPSEHNKSQSLIPPNVLSKSDAEHSKTVLDAAQDMVLYLRNEVSELKDDIEALHVDNLMLKKELTEKEKPMSLGATAKRCDRLASLMASVCTSGTIRKNSGEYGIVHPEIRSKLDRIYKESYEIVSMEKELRKRQKTIDDLRKIIRQAQKQSKLSSQQRDGASSNATIFEAENNMLHKEKLDLKRIVATQENIINNQNNRILSLTGGLEAITSGGKVVKGEGVTSSTTTTRAINALAAQNAEYRQKLENHDMIVQGHITEADDLRAEIKRIEDVVVDRDDEIRLLLGEIDDLRHARRSAIVGDVYSTNEALRDDSLPGDDPVQSLPSKQLKGPNNETSRAHAAEDVAIMVHIRADGLEVHEHAHESIRDTIERSESQPGTKDFVDTRIAKSHVIDSLESDHPVHSGIKTISREKKTGPTADKNHAKELNKLAVNFKHTFEIATLLRHIIDADLEISRVFNVDYTISACIKQACCVLNCERASLWVVDRRRKLLWTRREGLTKPQTIEMPWSQGVAGFVLRHEEFAHIKNTNADHRYDGQYDEYEDFKTRNILACPLYNLDKEIIAVLEVRNKRGGKIFSMIDEISVQLLGRQVAHSVEHALKYEFVLKKYNTMRRVIHHSFHLARNVIDNDVLDFMVTVEEEVKQNLGAYDCACFLKDFEGTYLWTSSRIRDSKVMVYGQASTKEVRRVKYRCHARVGIAGHVIVQGNEVVCKKGTDHAQFNDNMDIDNQYNLCVFPMKLGEHEIVGCLEVSFIDASPEKLELLREYCSHIASFAHLVAQIEVEKESDITQAGKTIENLFNNWRLERQSKLDDKERDKIKLWNKCENWYVNAIDSVTNNIFYGTRERKCIIIQMCMRRYLARKEVRFRQKLKNDRERRDAIRRKKAIEEKERKASSKGRKVSAGRGRGRGSSRGGGRGRGRGGRGRGRGRGGRYGGAVPANDDITTREATDEEIKAATKLQALQRGKHARQNRGRGRGQVRGGRGAGRGGSGRGRGRGSGRGGGNVKPISAAVVEDDITKRKATADEVEAATKLQALQRGKIARRGRGSGGLPAAGRGGARGGGGRGARGGSGRGAPAGMRGRRARGAPAGMRGRGARGAPAGMRGRGTRGTPAGTRGRGGRGVPAGMRGRGGGQRGGASRGVTGRRGRGRGARIAPPSRKVSGPEKVATDDKVVSPKASENGKSVNDTWDRVYDNGSDAYYFQHKETFETTWETPPGFIISGGGSTEKAVTGTDNAVHEEMDTYLKRLAEEHENELVAPPPLP